MAGNSTVMSGECNARHRRISAFMGLLLTFLGVLVILPALGYNAGRVIVKREVIRKAPS